MNNFKKKLVEKAVKENELVNLLIGTNSYEIRTEYVYMPTDTDSVGFLLADYISKNPKFDYSLIIRAMLEISKNPEWSWLVIFYVSAFETNNLTFLPYEELYKNVQNCKKHLRNNDGWICFNFKPKYSNLWDIIKNENNNRLKPKYNVPELI
ncbi:hypothetical protein [Hyunsoonleella rubra]|uniref:Uncharacterized protein n=1 Tax=Hyunsoonleella rubra TaxID=1737062 RepID=A0ABW5TAP6_9FLAO